MVKTANPKHIAIILDGNRRWAVNHHVSAEKGHREGSKNLERIVNAAIDKGTKILTVYALSTENFSNRSKREIKYLLELMRHFLIERRAKLMEIGARLNILGDISVFPERVQKTINETSEILKNNKKLVLNMAVNYGGRQDIIQAVKEIVKKRILPEKITEKTVSDNLYTAGEDDPDLIIRTGGRVRLSNFLLWQGSYSEWYFTSVLWLDFSPREFNKALEEYHRRKRNFGK